MGAGAERGHGEKGKEETHPRSCVKLQMGQATSLCLWRESGMTGCSRSCHDSASISLLSLLLNSNGSTDGLTNGAHIQ